MKSSYEGPSEYTTLTPLRARRSAAASSVRSRPHERTPPATPASSRSSGWSRDGSAEGPAAPAASGLNASSATFRPASAAASTTGKRSPARAGRPSKSSASVSASASASAPNSTEGDDRPLCRYHFLGEVPCMYGDRCRFSHSFPRGVSTVEEARKRIPCQYYLRGGCRYGDACLLGHDVAASSSSASPSSSAGTTTTTVEGAVSPSDGNDGGGACAQKVPAGGVKGQGEKDRGGGEDVDNEEDDDRTCGICFEDVSKTEGGCFGLLSCCDHRFCLTCLRQWRRTRGTSSPEVVRSCPTCREKSDYVVPSRKFVKGCEKERVVADFRARMAVKPCDKFDGTMGSCPFGRECFYAHMRGGVDVKSRDRDPAEMARERARRNRRRHHDDSVRARHFLPSWVSDDFAGTANADDIEAIASFLALLSFYGYGFSDDSDDDEDPWGDMD